MRRTLCAASDARVNVDVQRKELHYEGRLAVCDEVINHRS